MVRDLSSYPLVAGMAMLLMVFVVLRILSHLADSAERKRVLKGVSYVFAALFMLRGIELMLTVGSRSSLVVAAVLVLTLFCLMALVYLVWDSPEFSKWRRTQRAARHNKNN